MARRGGGVSTTRASVARVIRGGRSGGGSSKPSKTKIFGGTGRTAKAVKNSKGPKSPTAVLGESATSNSGAVTGVATTNLLSRAAHGFLIGDQVRFSGMTGGAGLVAG